MVAQGTRASFFGEGDALRPMACPTRCPQPLASLDTGAAHDQRRDSVTIEFGRTREKERKSKPIELRRVE